MQLNRVSLNVILVLGLGVGGFKSQAQAVDSVKNIRYDFPVEANTALKYHYDLPVTVLGYKDKLSLTDAQVTRLKSIAATLKLKKTETDISAKRNENMLDSLFKTGRLNEGVIIFYTNRYGLYEGEYRGAVLLACYDTRKVLTPQQLNKLFKLQNHN